MDEGWAGEAWVPLGMSEEDGGGGGGGLEHEILEKEGREGEEGGEAGRVSMMEAAMSKKGEKGSGESTKHRRISPVSARRGSRVRGWCTLVDG